MQSIDFKTSHNIVLNYSLATLGQRMGAFAIDLLTVVIIQTLLSLLIGSSHELLTIVIIVLYFFYQLSWELYLGGQSPGKRLLKIRIVSLSGAAPSLKQYLTRWFFKMLDVMLTLGTLAISSILASNNGQRLGDVMAGTAVVTLESNYPSLIQESQSSTTTTQKPLNHHLSKYNDEEMLIVKTLLSRYKSKQTQENLDLMLDLADKISKDINEKYDRYEVQTFLENVLKDYIVLTR
jgi:uncharacterized RDD family membrane protein YckC